MANEKEPFVTAEDAIFELDLAAHGMHQGGMIGRLEGDEARKLAVYLFKDEEDPMPEELKKFFGFKE